MQVTKEEFEKFINSYKGPGELMSYDINFITPNSTIYYDIKLHPEMSGMEKITNSIVAEHTYQNPYLRHSEDVYEIFKNKTNNTGK